MPIEAAGRSVAKGFIALTTPVPCIEATPFLVLIFFTLKK